MIICSTNLSYLNLNFKEFISVIKKIGYKNIELAPYVYRNKYTIKNIIEIKKKLKDEKIRIKSLQSIFSNMDIKNNDFSLIKKAMYNRIDNIIRIAKKYLKRLKKAQKGEKGRKRRKRAKRAKRGEKGEKGASLLDRAAGQPIFCKVRYTYFW